jgi:hypothetical protein
MIDDVDCDTLGPGRDQRVDNVHHSRAWHRLIDRRRHNGLLTDLTLTPSYGLTLRLSSSAQAVDRSIDPARAIRIRENTTETTNGDLELQCSSVLTPEQLEARQAPELRVSARPRGVCCHDESGSAMDGVFRKFRCVVSVGKCEAGTGSPDRGAHLRYAPRDIVEGVRPCFPRHDCVRDSVGSDAEAALVEISSLSPRHGCDILVVHARLQAVLRARPFDPLCQQIMGELFDDVWTQAAGKRSQSLLDQPKAIKPERAFSSEKTRDNKKECRYPEALEFRGGYGRIAALTVIKRQQAEGPRIDGPQALRKIVQVNEIEPPVQGVNMIPGLLARERVFVDDDAPHLKASNEGKCRRPNDA